MSIDELSKKHEFIQDALHHTKTHQKWLKHCGNSLKLHQFSADIYEDINGFLGQFADKLSDEEQDLHLKKSSAVFNFTKSLQDYGQFLHQVSMEAEDPEMVAEAVKKFNEQFGDKLAGIAGLNKVSTNRIPEEPIGKTD